MPQARRTALLEADRAERWVELGRVDRLAEAEALSARLQTVGTQPMGTGFAAEAFFEVFRPDTDSDDEEAQVASAQKAQAAQVKRQAVTAQRQQLQAEREAAAASAAQARTEAEQRAMAAAAAAEAAAQAARARKGSFVDDLAVILGGPSPPVRK